MDRAKRSLEAFKRNNPQIFNYGNENINVNGDKNIVIKTTNIYNHPPKKIRIKENHQYDPEIHISPKQQKIILDKTNEIGDMLKDIVPQNYYSYSRGKLKKYFNVPMYSLILKEDYDKAIEFLQKEFNILRKTILKPRNATKFKEITIPLIHIRWNYMRKDEDLLLFASEKLNKPIMSLYTLSANDIDTLYTRVHSLKKRK